jgi:urea transport system ATP-binding protein
MSPMHRLAQMGIGYVPQGRMIFPLLTVRENLETGFACLPKGEHRMPDEIFELFPVLKEMLRTGAAATCRAGSSSNWPSRAR